jgi:hypothetical protein
MQNDLSRPDTAQFFNQLRKEQIERAKAIQRVQRGGTKHAKGATSKHRDSAAARKRRKSQRTSRRANR